MIELLRITCIPAKSLRWRRQSRRIQIFLNGAVGSVTVSNYKNSYQNTNTASTTNTYVWWDNALQGTIAYKPNTSQSTTYNTYFNYDGQGALSTVSVNDGRPRSVTYVTNGDGQIVRRDEADYTGYNATTGLGIPGTRY